MRALLFSPSRYPAYKGAVSKGLVPKKNSQLSLETHSQSSHSSYYSGACFWRWGRGSKHAYSHFFVFIESSLIYISQKPIIIIIPIQNANTLFFLQTFGDKHNQTARRLYSPKYSLHAQYGSFPVPFVKVSFTYATSLSNS